MMIRTDARARTEGMSPEKRLRLHQEESRPVMDRLKTWMDALLAEKKAEPNSGLGQAIAYVQKRWERKRGARTRGPRGAAPAVAPERGYQQDHEKHRTHHGALRQRAERTHGGLSSGIPAESVRLPDSPQL